MFIGEWDCIPFRIETAEGTLTFNADSGQQLLLQHERCSAGPVPLRDGADNMPQADGSIINTPFKPGYQMVLVFELWQDGKPAWYQYRRLIWEDVTLKLNSMLNADAQVFWTPSGGYAERSLQGTRLRDWPIAVDTGFTTTVTTALHSSFADPSTETFFGPTSPFVLARPPRTTYRVGH